MIRVRFHGRGGQGMKTASRILGTAAVLDGLIAQDSPVYGAERRGAPMSAHVRIARLPILERGMIPAPTIVVVADDTLLHDPLAQPLAGVAPVGTLLITTRHPAEEVRQYTQHLGPIVARDFVALALEEVGTASGISAALGAAACALVGLPEAAINEALRQELTAIGLSAARVEANLRLATRARAGLGAVEVRPSPTPGFRLDGAVVDITYVPPELGTANIAGTPGLPFRKTGNWRVFRPVIDLAECTRCWICFVRCPDGAIELDAEDCPHVDEEACKGCLICVEECPTHAITAVREGREWEPRAVGS